MSQHSMNSLVQKLFVATLSAAVIVNSPTVFSAELTATPRVVGERVTIASQIARLAECELVVGTFYISTENWREDLVADVVYLQSPQDGDEISRLSTIGGWTFRQSTTQQKLVRTPDVRSLNFNDAQKVINSSGLILMNRPHEAGQIKSLNIMDQYPRPGQVIFEQTSIFVTYAPASP